MPQINIETLIDAPAHVCFDLMRDPRVHRGSKLEISGGPEISVGQRATFESRVMGIAQKLTVEVVECDRPNMFVDEMVHGRLTSFRHVHEFRETNGTTKLADTLTWESTWGKLADVLIERRLRSIVIDRNQQIKKLIETND
jgi:ligand-binding SRPBCC domain-containing protein